MSLDITIKNGKVLLAFFPEMQGPDAYVDLLKERENIRIYNTFSVTINNVVEIDGDYVLLTIGYVDGKYNRIISDTLGTKRDYCFGNDINLGKKDFIGVRKTSCQTADCGRS